MIDLPDKEAGIVFIKMSDYVKKMRIILCDTKRFLTNDVNEDKTMFIETVERYRLHQRKPISEARTNRYIYLTHMIYRKFTRLEFRLESYQILTIPHTMSLHDG